MQKVDVNLNEYTYELPEEKIAKFPLKSRDSSKLLHYNGEISHHHFRDVSQFLPANSTIFFNNTKVIPARLLFQKSTGASIEIFLLEPVLPSRVMSEAMTAKASVTWSCMIGNAKKWKDDQVLEKKLIIDEQEVTIKAKWNSRSGQQVTLEWLEDYTFAEVVEASGKVPLPPYIDREVTDEDKPRYQTVYSKIDGAVAAPTAGLHFTENVLKDLDQKQIEKEELTLHVSAGTFQPIKATSVEAHDMHSEEVIVSKRHVEALINSNFVTAVGTTSMRTLESLYWYGVKILNRDGSEFQIPKLYPYADHRVVPSLKESMEAILSFMNKNNLSVIVGHTEIFIFPGYDFKVCDALITNFHLPGSTLILLVAAFVGEDWRRIYESALQENYRFLSYGDSSVLFRSVK